MRIVVVASGALAPGDEAWLDGADAVIAADGGAAALDGLGRRPDRLVGDLDSADAALVERLEAAGVVVDRHPTDKDASDTELAVRAEPNGYTLFLGNVNTMAINPFIQKMKVDPIKDLVAIAPVASIPTVIVGHVSVTGNTLKEYLNDALRSKREIRYGTATLSSPSRFIMTAFLKSVGIKILEVPYNGAGPATTALLAGEMEILPVTVASIAGLVKAGKLKGLAAMAKERVAMLPDVPTMPELGYPEIISNQWNGVFGPTGMPRPVVAKLHKAITSAMKQEQTIERLKAVAAEAVFSPSPDEYAAYVRGEHARWGKIIRASGITLK